jgi:hypothetical protein
MDSNGSGYGPVSPFYDYGNKSSYAFLERLYAGCKEDGHFGIKFSLCLTNYAPRHEDVWGRGAPPFLTSALDGGQWSASLPGRFTLG